LAPHYEKLATDFVNEADVVIAKIDAEADDSKQTAAAEGVSGYPTLKWFSAHSTDGVVYNGPRTEDGLIEYINEQAGTHRSPGGGLTDKAGVIPFIDTIIQKIVDDGDSIAKRGDEILVGILAMKSNFAQYYGKVVDKIKKNEKYAETELARLEKLIAKGQLVPEKLDDITIRSNILRKFVVKKGDGKAADATKQEKGEL
jgi:protein disulfide-isomerase A6